MRLARQTGPNDRHRIAVNSMFPTSLDVAKLEVEIELAKRAQLSLLPKDLPRIAGLDIWAATRAAYHVGGDFYDFIEHSSRRLTLVVGDVSGKGLADRLFMAVTPRVISTKVPFRAGPTPETILLYSN